MGAFEDGFDEEMGKIAHAPTSPKQYVETVYRTPAFEVISDEDSKREYAKCRKRCDAAIAHWEKKDRQLEVLAIHGSGRDLKDSCAQAESNSTRLLREGLKALEDSNAHVTEVHLRERKYNRIEGCNNCVSTASSHCGYPCDCFPLTGEPAQMIYPLILKADVILMSSGVKQASMDSRLKMLIDRLISLDGGYARKEWAPKDREFRDARIKESQENVVYIPRMANRVAAYFLSSKDQKNPDDLKAGTDYVGMVSDALWTGNNAYLMKHPDPFYVCFFGRWDEDYSYDHGRMLKMDPLIDQARQLVLTAVKMADQFRRTGYPPIQDQRVNRT